MTPHEILATGGVEPTILALQKRIADLPSDNEPRRLLVELLVCMAQYDEVIEQLQQIQSESPNWPEIERELYRIIRAARRRSSGAIRPTIRPESVPIHAQRRWSIIKALRHARPEQAVRAADAAEAVSPVLSGFVNGMEFDGLRDADDRFASILEVYLGGEYCWFVWEGMRKLTLFEPLRLLDHVVRPGTITLKDGREYLVHLPMVYPCSHQAGDEFALGLETDYICPDHGPTRCVGGKLLLVGDDGEFPLRECRMIEFR
jgi:type VI secretion system protein ImpE